MRHAAARSKGAPSSTDGVGSVTRHKEFTRRKLVSTYLQECFYFLPCGRSSLRESCRGI
jgi:hypothetical protein